MWRQPQFTPEQKKQASISGGGAIDLHEQVVGLGREFSYDGCQQRAVFKPHQYHKQGSAEVCGPNRAYFETKPGPEGKYPPGLIVEIFLRLD